MDSNLDAVSILDKGKQLLRELSSDEELKSKAISFVTHVSKFDVDPPIVDVKEGRILIYMTTSGDIGKVSIPIIINVKDATETRYIADAIHELISDYILGFIRSAYEVMHQHVNEIKQPDDALPYIGQVIGEILTTVTDDRFNELGDIIGPNITSFDLVCDTTDSKTYELVKIDPDPNLDKKIDISKIVVDMLDFINRLWGVFVLPLISSLLSTD